jgi:hypothetical protein
MDRLPTSIWRPFIRAALAQGWTIGRRTKHGLRLLAPDGRTVITLAGSPGDVRTWNNTLSALRRAGLRLR